MSKIYTWLGVAMALGAAAAGCKQCTLNQEPVAQNGRRECERDAERGVIAELEQADAPYDREQQLDCAAVRRELACALDPAQRSSDDAALAELRKDLPGARASRAELVAMLVGDETDPALIHATAARMCVPIEREIATRQFLALHPDRRPAEDQQANAEGTL